MMIGCHGFLMSDSGFFFPNFNIEILAIFFPPKIENLVDFTQEKYKIPKVSKISLEKKEEFF